VVAPCARNPGARDDRRSLHLRRHIRPLYSLEYAHEAFHAWDLGWGDGDYLLDIRGQEEARRWLEDAA
jgi:hypothetical protein